MKSVDWFQPSRTGLAEPNTQVRNYDLSAGNTLVGLLDNPWYPPYVQDAQHVHNCMEIGMCMYGAGEIAIGDRMWAFSEGTVIVVPKNVPHAQQNRGEPLTRWRYVLINEDQYLRDTPLRSQGALSAMLRMILGGVLLDAGRQPEDVHRAIEELFRAYALRGTTDGFEMEALTRLLLARILSSPPETHRGALLSATSRKAVEPALQFISRNYAQDMRIGELASVCAMSESYFRKVFERIMGIPPMEYLNRYRVNRSVYLLYTTNETVLSIAGLCGFASIATYNRNFMRYVGLSPGEWRKRAQSQK
ncbi:MAG: helix-turn-helix transcriptional regulator [Clostridia bacterium]|nr:helix-turn-helix transcriptional regulator [Clostridia bacterium]